MPVSRSPYFPGYSFDTRMQGGGQYRAANGRLVKWAAIREETARVVADSKERMQALGLRLVNGELGLEEWRQAMRAEVKLVTGLEVIVAHGGWQNMDNNAWLEAARAVKEQYAYLDRFAAQLSDGRQGLNGRVAVRCGMYAESGHTTFELARQRMAKASGATEARNVLGPTEKHCTGAGSCIEETAKGWTAIDALSLPGRRLCLVNCRCTLEYR